MAKEVEFKDTVMGKITQDALVNWNGLSKEEAESKAQELGSAKEASDNVTYGSETASIEGIGKILGLSDEEIATLTQDVQTKVAVSEELAGKIKSQFEERGKESSIIEVLSEVHDNWVKTNGKKFADPTRMGKLYQFTDLKLLDFKEAKADLLFLKPILEAAGVEVDEKALEEEFLKEQEEFKEVNGITDRKSLKEYLSKGAESYPSLEGVETTRGKTAESKPITDVMQEPDILDSMTAQVSEKARVAQTKTVSINEIAETAETLTKQTIDKAEKDIIDNTKDLQNEKDTDGKDTDEKGNEEL